MDIAGEFNYYADSAGPTGMAKCILLHGATLITVGKYGGIACIVVITLDRFWKVVFPIHYRKYYRAWMLKVGLFLPWLNGVAVNLLPALGTSRIVNGICYPLTFWPSANMNKVYVFVSLSMAETFVLACPLRDFKMTTQLIVHNALLIHYSAIDRSP